MLQSNITFFVIFAVLVVWYMYSRPYRRCKLLSFCLYRQDVAKRQTAGIKFTHRTKIRFFRPAGATRCTDSRQTWQDRRALKSDSLNRFLKFLGNVMCLTILREHFKLDVIRFTDYWVIAEKPRVGQLGRFFFVRWIKKWRHIFWWARRALSPCKVWGRSHYARRL